MQFLYKGLLAAVLLFSSALGQNATNSTIEPDPVEPTVAPADQTNSTEGTQSPAPSASPQVNATSPPIEPPEKLECYDNTTILREHLLLKNAFTPETYTLCSNTLFEVGVAAAPGQPCCLDGQAPLHPRSNAKIQCGPDGNPNNNCTFVGGNFQVFNVYTVFYDQPENAVIEGVTFKDAVSSAALLVNGGSVLFRNCIFEGHSGDGPIVSFHTGPSANPTERKLLDSMEGLSLAERVNWNIREYTKLLRGEESAVDLPSASHALDLVPMKEASDERGEERKLQADIDWKLQEFVFESCTFQHNTQGGPVNDLTKFGIVTIELPYDLGTFENCTFYNNSYGNPDDGSGYAIRFAAGSKLTLINNCFIDNNFIGDGPVVLASAEDLTDSSGNYGTEDDLLTCQFIYTGEGDTYECMDFEATGCASGPVDISSAASSRTSVLMLVAALVSFVSFV